MPPNQNPYDFLNTPTPKRGFGAATQKGRIIQVAIIASVFLVIFAVVFSFISSADDGAKKPLYELYAAQTDLIALTTLADTKARDSAIKSQAKMINQTVVTHSVGTAALLKTYGASKDVAKDSAVYRDTAFEVSLKKANETNTFDTAYKAVLAAKIGTYRAKLKNSYGAVTTAKQQKELSDYYSQLETLVPTQ